MSSISDTITSHRPDLAPYEDLYRDFHRHPELSFLEHRTAERVHATLKRHASPSYAITTGIGGTGIAAVLENGAGPTVLLRADMDALPVQERTGLDYASTAHMKDVDGVSQPVMHACGHDMHVASLLATAELLHSAREAWSGTLVLVFQPAEEKGKGAQAMIDAGLYTTHKIPIPDIVLGGHVAPFATGSVLSRKGLFMGAADSFRITIHGHGSHASTPHLAVDPVVSAAHATVRLQDLVSRSINPSSSGGVVTVASIQAGYAENVIPSEAEMKVDIRSSSDEMRKTLVDGVRRIVRAEATAAGMEREPDLVKLREFPLTENEPVAFDRVSKAMHAYFGSEWVDNIPPITGSEDFSIFARAVDRPYVFWDYGGYTKEYLKKMKDEGKEGQVPYNHSPFFAPVIQPTLKTGVDAYAVAAFEWLHKGKA